MIGADVDKYTTRFHELARLVPRKVTLESKRIDRYIRGLASTIRRNNGNQAVIPIGHGSFDVILGMNWLSNLRAKIVCFDKTVQIPLSNRDILEVNGERPRGNLKQLKTMKVNEPKLDDIPVVREFPSVFPEDLSGLPLSSEVEFRIDLIPGAMPVAKSPYRLEPMNMQELSNQLKELQEKAEQANYQEPLPLPRIGDLFDQLTRPYIVKFVVVFINDILIYPKSKEEHEVHLKLIPELLEKEKLFGEFLKCAFQLQEVHFLEHVVNSKGYYRRFIANFSKIAKPLTLLTQKNKKFEWGDEQEIAFLTLKDMLCDAPILALLEGTYDFVARILEAQSEASKSVNTLPEMLKGLDKQLKRKEDGGL
ncbi:hypothetical protein Tco_0856956 [Tanacetum coccineum]|uniref:Reverse transcriptase domain-containing protein n=1 Tax=Tanacetum coccineum TaxID=301880 RepID=A0ABQ5B958_9ASTR